MFKVIVLFVTVVGGYGTGSYDYFSQGRLQVWDNKENCDKVINSDVFKEAVADFLAKSNKRRYEKVESLVYCHEIDKILNHGMEE
jgi:hypothetical protein